MMFADGSCVQNENGQPKALYAIVTPHETLEDVIPRTKLAQQSSQRQ